MAKKKTNKQKAIAAAKRFYKKHKLFIRYSAIGASGALLDLILFLTLFNGFHLNALVANLISTSAGITNNFILNRQLNFKKKDFVLLRFLAFYAAGLAGILLSTLLLRLFHDYGGINANVVKLGSIVLVVIMQYFINKHVSFRDFKKAKGSNLQVIGNFLRAHIPEMLVIALVATIFIAFIPRGMLTTDEADNFLSAKLMLSGQMPYTDFFSHHMPGAYFFSMLLYALGNGDVLGFRIAASSLIFAWTLLNFALIRRHGNRFAAMAYLLLMGTAHSLLYGYAVLAEVFILYSLSTAVIMLLLLPEKSWRNNWTVAGLGLVLGLVPILGISYIYAAALLYFIAAKVIWTKQWKALAIRLGLLALPYIAFAFYLKVTHAPQEFLFQNLEFNAKYYSPYYGDLGNGPLQVLRNVALGSLQQVSNVVTQVGSHFIQFLMLLGFLLLPAMLWAKNQRFYAVTIGLLLLVLNPRVGVFGPPAIEERLLMFSQHTTVYRGLALVFASLAIVYLANKSVGATLKKHSLQGIALAVAVVYFTVIPVHTLAISNNKTTSPPLHPPQLTEQQKIAQNPWTSYKLLPGKPMQILNSATTADDYAWVGPIDFIDQAFMVPKRATNFTFYLPWHYDCEKCQLQFTKQLEQQKPMVILWYDGYSLPTKPTPDFGKDVRYILQKDYYQYNTTNPDFANLYFLKAQGPLITERLEKAGYGVK